MTSRLIRDSPKHPVCDNCYRCGKRFQKGEELVTINTNNNWVTTHHYHKKCYTYADGEPVFK